MLKSIAKAAEEALKMSVKRLFIFRANRLFYVLSTVIFRCFLCVGSQPHISQILCYINACNHEQHVCPLQSACLASCAKINTSESDHPMLPGFVFERETSNQGGCLLILMTV